MPKVIVLKEKTVDNDNNIVNKEIAEFTIEHSLLSISKWEQKYHRPFINAEKSAEEMLDYIIMMIIEPEDFNLNNLKYLSDENLSDINNYINDPMTATTFPEDEIEKVTGTKQPKKKKEILTNELIYYWMSAANIPFECENWHINRLLTLIRVYDVKNQPEKKMSKKEIANRNRALNEARKKKLHTRG